MFPLKSSLDSEFLNLFSVAVSGVIFFLSAGFFVEFQVFLFFLQSVGFIFVFNSI